MASDLTLEAERPHFVPHPRQREFIGKVLSGDYSFLTYGGAMGGGKSFVSIAVMLMLARLYDGSKWCIIRESVPTLKRTTIETFKKIVPKDFIKSYNQQDQVVTFTNGSQFLFMAEDWQNDKDFDRFKGLEVNGFLLEQIEELQEGLLDVCMIRAGRWKLPKMPKPLIVATVNPTQNWVKERIYKPAMAGTLPKGWFYMRATLEDNPELANDSNYMAQLQNLDSMTYKRHIQGDWSAFAVNNPFCWAFDENRHVQSCEFDPTQELTLAVDFNVDPLSAFVCQNYETGKIRILREYRLMNGNIYDLCDRLIADWPNVLWLVTGDATGQSRSALTQGNVNYYTVIKQRMGLSSNQMKQPHINPSIRDTRVLLNSILQNGDFLIDPSCEWTIKDLKLVEVDGEGSILKDRKNDARFADFIDCLRYNAYTFHRKFIKIIGNSE